eukprot:Amastigsp_a8617_6.p4 type:complete len:112 gc:universal Amastigsp_a8617_6:457-122(-)
MMLCDARAVTVSRVNGRILPRGLCFACSAAARSCSRSTASSSSPQARSPAGSCSRRGDSDDDDVARSCSRLRSTASSSSPTARSPGGSCSRRGDSDDEDREMKNELRENST